MVILNQPYRLSFRFREITPGFGASKNIVRMLEFIFESSKLLHDKLSSNEETLQIHKYWYRRDCYRREDCGRLWCVVDFYIVFRKKSDVAFR